MAVPEGAKTKETMTSEEPTVERSHSVTLMIQQLKDDPSEAAGAIWQRFFTRLLPLARARLRGLADQSVDEEDLLVSVFDRFFVAASEDRFARLHDRDDLWQILLMLTDHQVAEQYRRSHAQKRGGGKVASLDGATAGQPADWRSLAEVELPPEYVVAFNDNMQHALAKLDEEKTRNVALLKLEGYENREIARQLGISLSSVERKLRVVREKWQGCWKE